MAGRDWEIIFVDDNSPDGTADKLREIYQSNPRIRCIKRVGRRGLSSACIEGIFSSSARYVAVMDADLQHDANLLPQMLDVLRGEPIDLVIGSRYTEGGSVGDWNARRLAVSQFATRLAHLTSGRNMSDPMSGFFMMRRTSFEACAHRLSNLGFKILFDIIASSDKDKLRIKELPYQFGIRTAGESKLNTSVAFDFGILLLEKKMGRYIPVRFLTFISVDAIGIGVHFLVLMLALQMAGMAFAAAQTIATGGAMLFNFALNNKLTYVGQSLKGSAWLKGLLTFALACSVGSVANVGISSYLFDKQASWQISALLGAVLSSVWNYAVTSRYTWGQR
jgi:dolichol-phosphate mannosyltransferase